MKKMIWGFLASIVACSTVLLGFPPTVSTASSNLPAPIPPTSLSYNEAPSSYSVPLDSIIRVRCGDALGTAEVINGNMLITASHVVQGNRLCEFDNGTHTVVRVTYNRPDLDYAILTADTVTLPRIPIDCGGFVTGQPYLMIGYAHGRDYAIQIVVATDEFADRFDDKGKLPFAHVRTLTGQNAIPGMSGGPIFNLQGMMVGTTIAAPRNTEIKRGYARELRDTYLCHKE